MTTEKYYCLLYNSLWRMLNNSDYWNGNVRDVKTALKGIEIALQTVAAAEDDDEQHLQHKEEEQS